MVKGMNGNEKCTHWHGRYDSRWKGVVWSGVEWTMERMNKTKQNIAFELLLVFLILSHRKRNEKYLSSILIYCSLYHCRHIYTHKWETKNEIEGGQSIWNWLPFIPQKCMTRYYIITAVLVSLVLCASKYVRLFPFDSLEFRLFARMCHRCTSFITFI